ncbi:MAG: transporter [Desulfobacteraceae bacterium]|nr:transporter [Desulfobacteraceae bacterium]
MKHQRHALKMDRYPVNANCFQPLRPARLVFLCLILLVGLTAASTALASEGATSDYTPGSFGDFTMNIIQPGLSVRENVMYLYGTVDDLPPAYGISSVKLEMTAWVDLVQAVWATKDFKLLGGRYFANINIPVGFSGELKQTVAPPLDAYSLKDTTSGLGDIQAVPFGLAWDMGDFHFMAAENIIIPTGVYDVNDAANMGRNYWGYDTLFGFTWLDPKRGHEVSFTAGYIFNQENDKTHYKTGDEFHLDYTLAQYLSEEVGLGLVGYYYKQTTADSGTGYDTFNANFDNRLGGYKSTGGAVGPAFLWAPKVGGRPLNLIAKWLWEYEGTNRFKGGAVYISAAMTF